MLLLKADSVLSCSLQVDSKCERALVDFSTCFSIKVTFATMYHLV
jgi:hypothetical protein